MTGEGGGKFSDVYSSKVTKNEDERVLHSPCMIGINRGMQDIQLDYR